MNKSLLFILSLCILSCTSVSGPTLRVQKLKEGTDTIQAGDSAIIHFRICNDGTKDLIIEDYTISCECTTSLLQKGTIISPKDSVGISFTIKSDSSEKSKRKELLCTVKCNTNPQIHTIKMPVFIK